MEEIKKAKKEYEKDKRVGELLSSKLEELKDKFKLTDDNKKSTVMNVEESFEDYKKEYEKSLEVKIPNITPLGQDIVVTASLMNIMDASPILLKRDFDINLINSFKHTISDIQTVVAIGPDTKQVKIGDKIKVRNENFKRVRNPNSVKAEEVFELPFVEIEGTTYLLMHERDAHYIINK